MKRGAILAAIVIGLLTAVGPAGAGAPDGAAGPWADFVVSFNQGFAINGGFLPNRSDPAAALGVAESPPGNDDPIPTGTFVSLGFGGTITLGFQNPICNSVGADLAIEVREITKEPYPLERAQVYVSEDGITFLFAGTVTKDGTVSMPAGITVANFVKLVDANNPADYARHPNADGFDLDGVQALNTTCPPGKIEVCKASSNGMSNRPFQFSLNGGSAFTVVGGRCSGPITTTPGFTTVRELPSASPTDVSAIVVRPSARLINQDLGGKTANVIVASGSTAASETRLTFTNEPGGGVYGDLKICKLTETPSYVGRLFTFHVNGGPAISTEANASFDPPSAWSCRPAGSFKQGTVVTVKEDIPSGTEVSFIDSDPADRLVDLDTNTGTARFTIGSGVTVALYDDEPIPPPATGFIEVCKDAAMLNLSTRDPDVTGPFEFTIDESDQSSQDVTVLAGQCSAPIPVAAGVVRVTEQPRGGFTLTDVFTIPNERLLDSNLINGTADVEVPVAADGSDETQVHFVNIAQRGQLKICKTLGPASADLIGRTFSFTLADETPTGARDSLPTDAIRITAADMTQCVIVGYFPIGRVIRVGEIPTFDYVDTTSSNNPVTIAAGVNTVNFTNTARGKLQICKFVTDEFVGQPVPAEANHLFNFRIDGGGIIKVRANTCSPPQLVSVGTHTVTELVETNYELDPNAPGMGINVTPADVETSRNLLARSVTVNVPWAGDPNFPIGREVRVDYYNRIKRAQIKVCKHVAPGSTDALGTKEFNFTVNTSFGTPYRVEGLRMEECALVREPHTGEIIDFPILTPGGLPTLATAEEDDTPFDGWIVSNITVQGARGTPKTNCDGLTPQTCGPPGTAQWTLGPNTNTVHFTNSASGLSPI
jgi:hypothetical protein